MALCRSCCTSVRNDGGKDRATDHPLYKLIHDRPNPWTSATEPLPRVEREALLSRSDIGRDFLAATKRQPFDVVHELFENEHVQLLFLFKISLFGTWLVDTMA